MKDPLDDVAPDIDRSWRDNFTLTALINGATGADIAASLAEANDHVKLSGETAGDVFGPPEQYAASLNLPPDPRSDVGHRVAAVVPGIMGVLAMQLVGLAVRPIRDGQPMSVTWGHALNTSVIAASMLLLAFQAAPILTFMTRHRVLSILGAGAWFALILVPVVLMKGVLTTVSPWPVCLAGIVLLLVTVRLYLGLPDGADQVAFPRAEPSKLVSARWMHRAMAAGFPLVTLAIAAMLWVIPGQR